MASDAFTRTDGKGARAYQAMEDAGVELAGMVPDDRATLKEYTLGVIGYSVCAAIRSRVSGIVEADGRSAAAAALDDLDPTEERSRSMSAWRDALAEAAILPLAEMHYEFGRPEYERLLREIVQGCLFAAKELKIPYQPVIKLLIVFLMNVCPHQGRPGAVQYLIKTLTYEITLSKLTLGIAMKLSAYTVGEAILMLALQDALSGRTDGPFHNTQDLLTAATEGNWQASELISPNSFVHLQDNGFYLVRGFSDAEARLRKSMISGTVERVLTLPVIGWIYKPMRWVTRVAYNRLKDVPFINKLWAKLME